MLCALMWCPWLRKCIFGCNGAVTERHKVMRIVSILGCHSGSLPNVGNVGGGAASSLDDRNPHDPIFQKHTRIPSRLVHKSCRIYFINSTQSVGSPRRPRPDSHSCCLQDFLRPSTPEAWSEKASDHRAVAAVLYASSYRTPRVRKQKLPQTSKTSTVGNSFTYSWGAGRD